MNEAVQIAIAPNDYAVLGAVLVRMQVLDEDELARALELQALHAQLLGCVLLELGLVTERELEVALDVQARMRSGDVVGAIAATIESAYARAGRQVETVRQLAVTASGGVS